MVVCHQVCPVVPVAGREGQIPDTVILTSILTISAALAGVPAFCPKGATLLGTVGQLPRWLVEKGAGPAQGIV